MSAKWTKKLTKRDLAHLADGSATGRPTLRSLRFNLTQQRANGIRCSECEAIARKLAIVLPA
jgi:hypothetical protein